MTSPMLHDGPEQVVLVDEQDREIGHMEKMAAHREGLLHRAFSVFILNGQGELLLQQRALSKYHSPGLWSNSCCGHPRPGEDVRIAAERRVKEEMGLTCELRPAFQFTYRAELGDGMIEHELDHVFIGTTGQEPRPAPSEAADWRFVSQVALVDELESEPEMFTAWFRICAKQAWEHLDPQDPSTTDA